MRTQGVDERRRLKSGVSSWEIFYWTPVLVYQIKWADGSIVAGEGRKTLLAQLQIRTFARLINIADVINMAGNLPNHNQLPTARTHKFLFILIITLAITYEYAVAHSSSSSLIV